MNRLGLLNWDLINVICDYLNTYETLNLCIAKSGCGIAICQKIQSSITDTVEKCNQCERMCFVNELKTCENSEHKICNLCLTQCDRCNNWIGNCNTNDCDVPISLTRYAPWYAVPNMYYLKLFCILCKKKICSRCAIPTVSLSYKCLECAFEKNEKLL